MNQVPTRIPTAASCSQSRRGTMYVVEDKKSRLGSARYTRLEWFFVGVVNHTESCIKHPSMFQEGIEPCSEHSGMVQKGFHGCSTSFMPLFIPEFQPENSTTQICHNRLFDFFHPFSFFRYRTRSVVCCVCIVVPSIFDASLHLAGGTQENGRHESFFRC